MGLMFLVEEWAQRRLRDDAPVEALHFRGDVVAAVFDREMTAIEPMIFGIGEHLPIGFTAFRGEEDVALAPEDLGVRRVVL